MDSQPKHMRQNHICYVQDVTQRSVRSVIVSTARSRKYYLDTTSGSEGNVGLE